MPVSKKCSRCKKEKSIDNFMKGNKELKTCDNCRAKNKASRFRNKCEHGRRKNVCIDCGGVSICHHGRIKQQCIQCGGSSICIHNIQKARCRQCEGSDICQHDRQKSNCRQCKDPKTLIIRNWINKHRRHDKKKNRFDPNNFIDTDFLKGLMEDYKKCYYCKVPFEYINFCNKLVTLERLDNNLGHIKSNCILACFHCNCTTYKTNLQKANFHQTTI